MKGTGKRKKKEESFAEDYRVALQAYVKQKTEEELKRAYELGRRAMNEGMTLIDIASVHHDTIHQRGTNRNGTKRQQRACQAERDFFAECLSPYEMARRGFHDAVTALRQMNETLEKEIKRIAYAVHDEAGQLLVTVYLALADLQRDLPEKHKEQIEKIAELLKQAEAQLRRYSHELRPTILDDLGWIPAIRYFAESVAKRTNLAVQVTTAISGRLSPTAETAVYRVVQEALTNAAKHAQASQVRIDIRPNRGEFRCTIQDDGVGINLAAAGAAAGSRDEPRGLGLIAMRERMNAIGGSFAIAAVRGKGTRVAIRFPMESS